ncbi:MAG: lamin tail domain-containing protein [Candidatus Cloacimonetes bacterium]|nr:lamin tail domain-containing protein [Candidatus Cloacimonadota bacterium]
MKKVGLIVVVLFFSVNLVYGDVFITELADPNNDATARYIELYNSGVSSVDFSEGSSWRIDKYTNASASVSQTLNLTGTIPAGGFYIIATGTNDGHFLSVYGVSANQFDGAYDNVAGSNGDDNLELYNGSGTLVDQFGVPGEDGTGTTHEFEDGRAERKGTVTTGNTTWDVNEWNIDNDSGGGDGPQDAPDDFDPAQWIGAATPTITLSTTSLNNFTYVFGNGPSSEQSFTAEGSDLSADISITSPTNYQISTGTGGSFVATNPITLTQSGGTVNSTTIYVRLKAGLSVNSYNNENISATSSGATSKTVSCSGAVTGTTPVEPSIGDLIISEIVGDDADGNASNDNGFMEIYNNTSSTISLNNIQARYYNSNPGPVSGTYDLSGYIEAGGYMVLTQNNTGFNSEYSFDADFAAGGSFYFNGGDDGVDIYLTTSKAEVLDEFNDNGDDGTPFIWDDSKDYERTSTSAGNTLDSWTAVSSTGTPGAENGHTLPVTLSTFTAQYINSKPTLYWSTKSEYDNIGWFIYRNITEDFTSADKITGMIEGHGTTTQQQDYIYTDIGELQTEQTYYYWLESVDYGGTVHHYNMVAHVTIPDPNDPGQQVVPPTAYNVSADPSPFSQSTRISFALTQSGMVDLSIYNVKGELVKTYSTTAVTADEIVEFEWNGKDDAGKILSNGVYLYAVKVNGKDYATKRMILMR